MAVGVRTLDLRKVYYSAPPLGAGGGFIPRSDAKNSKQPKPQITALDGLSLQIEPGEIFCLLGRASPPRLASSRRGCDRLEAVPGLAITMSGRSKLR